MVVALLISTYMLLDPADWLYDLMQFTYISPSFKTFVVVLAVGGFACSYLMERYIFPPLAKWIGQANARLRPKYQKKGRSTS